MKAFVIDRQQTGVMHRAQIDFLHGVIASYMDLNEWHPKISKNGRKTVRDLKLLRDEATETQKALQDKQK